MDNGGREVLTVTHSGCRKKVAERGQQDAFFGASHRPPPDERRQWPIPPGARAPELVGASSRSGFFSLCGGDGQRLVGFGFGPLPRATPRSSGLKPCCVRPTNGDNSRQSLLTFEPFWKCEPAAGADSFFLPRRRASRRVRVLCSLIVDEARSTPRRAAAAGIAGAVPSSRQNEAARPVPPDARDNRVRRTARRRAGSAGPLRCSPWSRRRVGKAG
jgi:hypothetical protein